MAELIIQKERKLEEIRIIVEGWNVPESQKFPNGIKYSYQAYNQKNGKTILRYDNHNKHAGSRNHKHIGNETKNWNTNLKTGRISRKCSKNS